MTLAEECRKSMEAKGCSEAEIQTAMRRLALLLSVTGPGYTVHLDQSGKAVSSHKTTQEEHQANLLSAQLDGCPIKMAVANYKWNGSHYPAEEVFEELKTKFTIDEYPSLREEIGKVARKYNACLE